MSFIQTVRGAIVPAALGMTLPHEHVLCDFIGADKTGPHRYDADEVVEVMAPHLEALRAQGVSTLIDCSPMYLGRDPLVLARLSEISGLHILTNTGLYKEPHLPPYAFEDSPAQLAARWIAEWEHGIGDSGIRPGFIKIAVNPGPLIPVQQKIVRAAAQTHLATGLAVASHTAHALAARESLDLIAQEGMDASRLIIVHADQIADLAEHCALAERGAWLEYDAIGMRPLAEHVQLVAEMVSRGYAERLLLSQDAGWYTVGEARGGSVRPFTALVAEFLPALRRAGVLEEVVYRLTVLNPARAFGIRRGPL